MRAVGSRVRINGRSEAFVGRRGTIIDHIPQGELYTYWVEWDEPNGCRTEDAVWEWECE